MSVFRISKHLIRGQFASAACFEKWLEQNTDAGNVQLITVREEPGLPPGGPNDWRYYIWRQDAATVQPPKGCDYDLVKVGTQIEWPTLDAALAVVDGKVKEAAKVDTAVKAANEKAVSVGNVVSSAADELAQKAGAGLDSGIPVVAKVALGIGGAIGLVWVLSRMLGGK